MWFPETLEKQNTFKNWPLKGQLGAGIRAKVDHRDSLGSPVVAFSKHRKLQFALSSTLITDRPHTHTHTLLLLHSLLNSNTLPPQTQPLIIVSSRSQNRGSAWSADLSSLLCSANKLGVRPPCLTGHMVAT